MAGEATQVTLAEIADDEPRLSTIESLVTQGMMLQALSAAQTIRPLESFRGARARVLAAWLADHLGGEEFAHRSYLGAARSAPEHPAVRYFHAYLVFRERGPLQAWLLLKDYVAPETATPLELADLASVEAQALACLHDHRQAERALSRCAADVLGRDRFASLEATLLEQRGEKNQALDLLEGAFSHFPRSRLLVQQLAGLLERLSRRADALRLLESVEPEFEMPLLALQRAACEHEMKDFDAELRSIERAERLFVLAGRKTKRRLSLLRAENSYRRGDVQGALSHARHIAEPWWEKFAVRLGAWTGPVDRRELEVPVVLQEPMSCAPASLAILATYFGRAVDHVDVADQICYEGTAAHSERRWAERAGFVSREFTVDFATARALIERDIPFLLVTVDVASAHAQVVVGFDATRRSLIVRDPMTYRIVELDADGLFENHRAYGPRGHVLVPPERASALDGVLLPDVELHDLAHEQRRALECHDRKAFEALAAEIERRAPEHPLSLWARRGVANANQDPYALREACERTLALHPKDANAEITVLDCLEAIGTTSDRRARLERRLAEAKPPWIFYEAQARVLATDVSELERAGRLARRALAHVPLRGASIELVAQIERDRGNSGLALGLFRAAATLEATSDELSRKYFEEALRAGQSTAALEFLADRAERFRARSGQPAIVLFEALEWLDRVDEAFAALHGAVARRSDDATLLLFSADAHARYQRMEAARTLLEKARPHASAHAYEQTAARIAELDGRLADALASHRAVLKETPLAIRSHAAVAYLLGELSGTAEARRHLAEAVERYSSHCQLRQLQIEWLRGHEPKRVLSSIDELLALQPAHSWARRERALVLSDAGQHERALEEAREVCGRTPHHASSQRVLSAVLLAAGRRAEALAPARKAVELAPDEPGCISSALRLVGSLEEQRELLVTLEPQVRQRTLDGTGLVEWHEYASGFLGNEELLKRARLALAERPLLWASHHVVASRLLRAGDAKSARELFERAVERFPFITRLFVGLADAFHAEGDPRREVAAALRATYLSPSWIVAALRAAGALLKTGDRDGARRTLQRALAFHPRSAELVRELAALSWDAGDAEVAFGESRRAIELDPGDEDSWLLHHRFAATLHRERDVVELAKRLAHERPWNAVIWLRLAEVLRRESENLASLDALSEALARRPGWSEALDVYAMTLAGIGRKNDAVAACEQPAESFLAKGALAARRAWVLWQFGEREVACDAMHRVIAEHPNHAWAHLVLVQWETERRRHTQAVAVARALVALAPLTAASHTLLADAELGAGNAAKARESFDQAVALDPSFAYAGRRRVELAIAEERLADGARYVREQGPHVPPESRDHWQLSLAVAGRDEASAVAAFERLACLATVPMATLYEAAKELEYFPPRSLERLLGGLARRSGAHAELGALWVTTLDNMGRRPSLLAIRRLRGQNRQTFETAVRAYFEALGDRVASFLHLLVALAVLGGEARRSDATWGKVGYALARTRAFILCQLWLGDYSGRRNAEAWMLHNHRVAALENHAFEAALRVVDHALTLPADNTLPSHLIFAAFGRAARGDIAGAREIVSGRTFQGLGEQDRWLFDGAELLVRLADSKGDERLAVRRELLIVCGKLLGAFSPFPAGMLRRRLAAAALRYGWDAGFLVRRFGIWVLLVGVVFFWPGRTPQGAAVTLVVLLFAYGLARVLR